MACVRDQFFSEFSKGNGVVLDQADDPKLIFTNDSWPIVGCWPTAVNSGC